MTVYFVTRHPGAVDWLREAYPDFAPNAVLIQHWTKQELTQGDVVIGILPIDLAADVCAAGAHFYALSLPAMTPEMRGKELSAEQMRQAGARLQKYLVKEAV